MPGIIIRLATHDDAAALPAIERSAAQAFLAIKGLQWIADDAVMAAAMHQIYIDESTVWIALSGSRPIGFVTTAVEDDALHILELAVEAGLQGQGIGQRLLETAKAHAIEQGLAAMTLTTFRDLPFNEHFYRRLGYQTLQQAELPERLAAILKSEIESGLPGDRRCAMRLDL